MKYQIVIPATVYDQIVKLADAIEQISGSKKTAGDFVDGLFETINSIADFPSAGCNPATRALLAGGYKFVIYKDKYLIFYTVEDKTVYIKSVFNSKQDYYRYFAF